MKKEIVCWNCRKNFSISASGVNPFIKLYKRVASLGRTESENKKKRLMKTCPFCGKENIIEV